MDVTELASLAANTVVTTAVTDAFEGVRDRVARLFGRGKPDPATERRLETTRAKLSTVPGTDAASVEAAQQVQWRVRFADLWAIRNGDSCMGLTVHRTTDRVDAGPILAQVDDLPLPDRVTSQDVWRLQQVALPGLLEAALDRLVRGDPGKPQDEEQASYAGFPSPDWYAVTWQGSRQRLHDQIRVLRYLKRGHGPVVEFQGRTVRVEGTSLTEDDGARIECPDGPLWVTCTPVALPEPCLSLRP